VAQAVQALRNFDGDPESVTEVYLLDEKRVLRGAISLARLVMAQPETRLAVLAEPRVLSCPADLHQNELAELFDKYNLHALPVVDAQGRMVGVVQADHVISFLREKLYRKGNSGSAKGFQKYDQIAQQNCSFTFPNGPM
jgi:magnesium transporter